MNKFRKIAVIIVVVQILLVLVVNWFTFESTKSTGRQYRVDVERASRKLLNGEEVNVDDYDYVVAVKPYKDDYSTNNDYKVVSVNGDLYAVEYKIESKSNTFIYMNVGLGLMLITTISVLCYVNNKVLKPFHNMSDMTVELAKGNLSTPIKEDKNKFFGRFLWGMDMLRDNLESNREKELQLQKEKKTLILSLSHDIKTPLSAIKLYNKALSENLYDTSEKREEAFEGIANNVVEIEKYVSEIVTASKEDFLNLSANITEFYISDVMSKITSLYQDKFDVLHTEFVVEHFDNCMIKGDADRLEEVLQNLLENAIKYGDGKRVTISMSDEEDCRLICVANSGCTLKEEEIPHLFDSFYRGTNSEKQKGSGLGLYIAKSLMRLMDGEIYAEIEGDEYHCVVVARKA